MQDYIERIKGIELKLKQVLQKMDFLKEENRLLLEENIELKERNNQFKGVEGTLFEVENQPNENAQLQTENQGASAEIKLELEKYIVEIDDCIEMLKAG